MITRILIVFILILISAPARAGESVIARIQESMENAVIVKAENAGIVKAEHLKAGRTKKGHTTFVVPSNRIKEYYLAL